MQFQFDTVATLLDAFNRFGLVVCEPLEVFKGNVSAVEVYILTDVSKLTASQLIKNLLFGDHAFLFQFSL